jgi:hypothetical protein
MQQYFHLTGVLGRWLYAARRLALLERAIGSKPPRRWLYLAVFRTLFVSGLLVYLIMKTL